MAGSCALPRWAAAFVLVELFGGCGVPESREISGPGGSVDAGRVGSVALGGAAQSGAGRNADAGKAGSIAAQRGRCTSSADCAAFAETKACDLSVGQGGAPGVVDLPAGRAGAAGAVVPIAPQGVCVECLPTPDDNHCGARLFCSEDKHCEIGCNTDADCPGTSCDPTLHRCVGCIDSTACPPYTRCDTAANPAICVPSCSVGASAGCPAGWRCCDGECHHLGTDPLHCGACGTACQRENAITTCLDGVCAIVGCNDQYADCNQDGSCETNLWSDRVRCGSCTTECAAGQSCVFGSCGFSECQPGYLSCDADPSVCETYVLGDPANCGGCRQACSDVHGQPTCTAGSCGIVCDRGWGDCDQSTTATTGCETDLTLSTLHCGGCESSCSNDHGSTSCSSSACLPVCQLGYADCDQNPANGCEQNIATDAEHCGACAESCRLAHAVAACQAGGCVVVECEPGFNDCDGASVNGCESEASTDVQHCGGCERPCEATHGTPVCVQGGCSITCAPGFGDCNLDVSDGCETDLTRAVSHCGQCNLVCPETINGTPYCRDGTCGVSDCPSPLGDCNGLGSDGCEANRDTDPKNCGACGAACSIRNGTPVCQGGVCRMAECQAGWSDCNNDAIDGCETRLNSSTDCGACGVPCSLSGATATCASDSCQVGSCLEGYADCDQEGRNGCEVNLKTDPSHCGACLAACSRDHGTPSCANSLCGIGCASGWGDCDGNVGTGCEEPLTSVTHCGACNASCHAPNGTPVCSAGGCAVGDCDPGFADCNWYVNDGCEIDINQDIDHCGSCTRACSRANGSAACQAGLCSISCARGFGDCNQDLADGCETRLDTNVDCGACGSSCQPVHASDYTCASGTCTITSCAEGWRDCNADPVDGCEINVPGDPDNCGQCRRVCTATNASSACSAGQCVLTGCQAGFYDCNGLAADGCEIDLTNDARHCGACGTDCFAGQNVTAAACLNGSCTVTSCATGYGDCSGGAVDGCETNLLTNVDHCRQCGAACSVPPGGTPSCTSGVCGLSDCLAPWADCSALAGCETDTSGDPINCGGCGHACSFLHASATCTTGECVMGSCQPGWGDCTGGTADGCETPLNTLTDCGGCAAACVLAHARESCSTGVCRVGTCEAGFGNCTGGDADGCETALNTLSNCGGCGVTCSLPNATATCAAGSCAIESCNPGYGNCTGGDADGCEMLLNSLTHCGGCNLPCSLAHASESCSTGSCRITACDNGYANCTGGDADGCESSLGSIENCGGCGSSCSYANATASCNVVGAGYGCSMGACLAGYLDCNGTSDGCEIDGRSDPDNCAGCGNACSHVHATPGCSNGECSVACDPGWGDCDPNVSNGCERDLLTNDASHCGACDFACPSGTPFCQAGSCVNHLDISLVGTPSTGSIGLQRTLTFGHGLTTDRTTDNHRLVVVVIASRGNSITAASPAPNGVSYNGTTMTAVPGASWGGPNPSDAWTGIYSVKDSGLPAGAGTYTVSITSGGSNDYAQAIVAAAFELTGVDQTTPVNAAAAVGAAPQCSASPPTASLTTTVDADFVVDVVAYNESTSAAAVATSGQSKALDAAPSAYSNFFGVSGYRNRVSPMGLTPMNWSAAKPCSRHAHSVAAFRRASG